MKDEAHVNLNFNRSDLRPPPANRELYFVDTRSKPYEVRLCTFDYRILMGKVVCTVCPMSGSYVPIDLGLDKPVPYVWWTTQRWFNIFEKESP